MASQRKEHNVVKYIKGGLHKPYLSRHLTK